MEFHLAILWRRVVDALKPLAKRLLELLGGEEEMKPVPVRVEREDPRHKSQQRSMWSWTALLLCLSACGGPNDPIIVTPPVAGPPPVVNLMAPTSGPLAGGTMVTIFGEHFDSSGGVQVLFGPRYGLNVSVLSGTNLQCRTPAGFESGNVPVTVLVGSDSANSPVDFYYESVPTAELELLWENDSGLTMSGVLRVELHLAETPLTVANFIALADEGLLDDTLVHEVNPNGDLVAGDFENGDGTGGNAAVFNGIGDEADSSTWKIPDESGTSPQHEVGSLGMFLPDGPDSAGSVFYIVGEDSDFGARDGVNTVFGQCVSATISGGETSFVTFMDSLSHTALDVDGDPVSPVHLIEVRIPDDEGPSDDGGLPMITLLDPSFGPPGGGFQAVVFGENFGTVADPVPTVRLGSIEITDVSLITSQAILITIPSGAPGSKLTLEVSTDAGTAVRSEAMHYFQGPAVAMGVTWTTASGVEKAGGLGVELYEFSAPVHVDNFIQLAVGNYYDGVSFHRVIDGFMVQGGDFQNGNGTGGHAFQYYGFGDVDDSNTWTVPDEADNGLIHTPGALSMAKTDAPNSGGSQFFFVDAGSYPSHLDGIHTVFGSAQAGFIESSPVMPIEVIDEMSAVPTNGSDVPLLPVLIDRANQIVATSGLLAEGAELDAVSVLNRRVSYYSPWNIGAMSAALGEQGQRLSGTGGIYSLELGAGDALRLLTRSRDGFKGSVPVHFFGERSGRLESESWSDPRDEEREVHQIVTEFTETVLVIFSPEAVEWSKAWVSAPNAPLDW